MRATHRGAPPAHTPTTSRSTTPPAPLSVDGIHPVSCAARQADLGALLTPVMTSTTPGTYDLTGLPILSVTTDGAILAGTRGDAPRLDLIRPDGGRTTLYRVPDAVLGGQNGAISSAQGDAHWITFAVAVGDGQATTIELGVVNRATGAVSILRTLAPSTPLLLSPPVLADGRIYWAEIDSAASGTVYQHDPVSHVTTAVDHGDGLTWPAAVGAGLYWRRDGRLVTYRPGKALPGFPLDSAKLPRIATDGTAAVWAASTTDGRVQLMFSRPGLPAAVVLLTSSADNVLVPLAVSGPYVLWSDGQRFRALDLRTGAVSRIGDDNSPAFSTVAAGGGTIDVNQIGSKGGAQLSITTTAKLPELTCAK